MLSWITAFCDPETFSNRTGRLVDRWTNRMGEGESKNFWQTAPGTLAGRFMRMFWQPIFRSEDLPPKGSKPLRILLKT